jgi:hypothetical protein
MGGTGDLFEGNDEEEGEEGESEEEEEEGEFLFGLLYRYR